MAISVQSLNSEDTSNWFEGVIFQNSMTDNKLGAYCKSKEFCLIVGAKQIQDETLDIVALGRWDGEKYSALNLVPLPFVVNPYQEVSGKSAVIARNIVSRLKTYMGKTEDEFFKEFIEERERYGISYFLG